MGTTGSVSDLELGTLGVTHPVRDDGPSRMRTRRLSYMVGTFLVTALFVTALIDDYGNVGIYGVTSGTRTAVSADGKTTVTVRYPTVARAAMASPFDIVVQQAGGFNDKITVALSWDWLEMWDENAFYPTPSSSWGEANHLVMEFDPPDGDVLRIIYDARIQPAQQWGRDGYVALVDSAGALTGVVRFHTRVMP